MNCAQHHVNTGPVAQPTPFSRSITPHAPPRVAMAHGIRTRASKKGHPLLFLVANAIILAATCRLTDAGEARAPAKDHCTFDDDVDLRCSLHPSRCAEVGNHSAASALDCCVACQASSRCTAAVWESWGETICYMKAIAAGQPLTDKRKGTVACIPKSGPPPPPFFPFRNTSLSWKARVTDLVGRLTQVFLLFLLWPLVL